MTADEATVAVIDALDRAGIPFMIVGPLAANFHGIPRSTRDADFVIRLDQTPIASLAAALPVGLRLEPQAAFETVTGTTRYLVTLRHSPLVCELFLRGDDPHDTARFELREARARPGTQRVYGHGRGHDHHEAAVGARGQALQRLR